jgi:hypothetical protein
MIAIGKIVLHHADQNNKKHGLRLAGRFLSSKRCTMSNAALKEQQKGTRASEAVYVASFEQLRMTDVESVGGKNASLGEMISQLAGPACACRAASPPRRKPSATSCPQRRRRPAAGRAHRRAPGGLDIDDVRSLAAAGAEIRQWIVETPFQPRLARKSAPSTTSWWPIRARDVVRRALVGHRRRLAGRLVRRPAGNLPERGRHRQRARSDEARVRLAVQRPRDLLPRAQGLHPRRSGAVGRRAAHGPLRPGRGRRHVHHRHRVRLQGRGVRHLQLRPGRDGGAGRGQSRTSSTSTSRCWSRANRRSSAATSAPS